MIEADVERKIRDYALANEVWYRKFVTPGRRFTPDRLLVAPNGTVGVLELKVKDNKPTSGQSRELKRWESRNILSGWASTVEQGKEFIDHLLELDGF